MLEVPCWTCGDGVEIEVDGDTVEAEHFGSPIMASENQFKSTDDVIDEHLDSDVPDGHHVAAYVECDDCCPVCNEGQ